MVRRVAVMEVVACCVIASAASEHQLKSIYRILSKISDTLIVWTPKYVIFSRSNYTGHGNFEGFPPL